MSDLARAEDSVSGRFTRLMNATTSPLGVLTDPSIVGLATAPFAIALLAAIRVEAAPALITGLEVLTAVPLAVALGVALSLARARAGVVAWLAAVPFPVENLNAVLNGLGEALEVTFQDGGRDGGPEVKALNASLDEVSPECFVSKNTEPGESPVVIELRIGVVDSKRNPSASNHQRFRRVRALVDQVLVPLARRHPVAEVRVK